MSDQYDFTWPSGETGFSVQPQTKDTSSTSLTITGRGSAMWGRDLQQNLLNMLVHFAGPTAPANAKTGEFWFNTVTRVVHVYDASLIDEGKDPWSLTAGGGSTASDTQPTSPQAGNLWYDTTNKILWLYDGSAYHQLYPVPSTEVPKVAFASEFNEMALTINKIVGTPQGTTLSTAFGWGQSGLVLPVETAATMTNDKWLKLLSLLTAVCTFLGVDTSTIAPYGFIYDSGNTIPVGPVTMTSQYNATVAVVNSLLADPLRFKPVSSYTESFTPATGTATRSTVWSGQITHEVLATYSSIADMQAFFNSGGQVRFVTTASAVGDPRGSEFKAFYDSLGTVKFSATGSIDSASHSNATGLYNLTTTYQLIFGVTGSGATAGNTFQINARLEGNGIRFQLVYINEDGLYSGMYGGITNTVSSITSLVRSIVPITGVTPHVYPTLTQTPLQ